MPITWDADNNHKMLLYLIKRIETKDIDVDNLATLFEGATPKAIRERVAKLRRESKLIDDGPVNPIVPGNSDNIDNGSSPVKASAAAGKSRGRPKKNAKDNVAENGGPVANGKGGKTGGKGAGGKRKRGGSVKGEEEGYGGDVEEEEAEGVKADGVKKVKTEEVNGEGEEGLGEMAFMEEEVEGEGEEGEEEGEEMVEA